MCRAPDGVSGTHTFSGHAMSSTRFSRPSDRTGAPASMAAWTASTGTDRPPAADDADHADVQRLRFSAFLTVSRPWRRLPRLSVSAG